MEFHIAIGHITTNTFALGVSAQGTMEIFHSNFSQHSYTEDTMQNFSLQALLELPRYGKKSVRKKSVKNRASCTHTGFLA
jgi:hypothetical protein